MWAGLWTVFVYAVGFIMGAGTVLFTQRCMRP